MGLLETVTRWQALAFNFGITYSTVNKIQTERRGNVERCMRDVIHNWLPQRDDVIQMGGCTKHCLITALREMEENAIVDKILGMFTSTIMCCSWYMHSLNTYAFIIFVFQIMQCIEVVIIEWKCMSIKFYSDWFGIIIIITEITIEKLALLIAYYRY